MSRRRETSLADLLRERQVIPRWKSPAQAASDNERTVVILAPRAKTQPPDWIKRLKAQLAVNPSLQTANELQETAFALGIPHEDYGKQSPTSAVRAAGVECLAKQLDWTVRSGEDAETGSFDKRALIAPQIGALRRRLSEHPGQALLWSELARHYLTMGSDLKARRAMECALRISGTTNRYLARSAARMFVHLDDQDRALSLLRSHKNIKRDPWLISAEIAVSGVSGKSSNLVKLGQSLVASRDASHLDTSELASAIGTIEHINGKRRSAENYFRTSLIDPTENALAQAQWAQDHQTKVNIPDSAWTLPGSFEAQAMAARSSRKWEDMLRSAGSWLRDEPFSLRPAAVGSSVSITREHNIIGERFASAGLMSAPKNSLLLNNRAVSRAYLGKLTGAFEDITIALSEVNARHDPHLLATIGLLAYRSGHHAFGAECYLACVSWFAKQKDRASVTLGALYWLREEVRIGSPIATEVLDIVRKQCIFPEVARAPETIALLEVVELEIESQFGVALHTQDVTTAYAPELSELEALSRLLVRDGEISKDHSPSRSIEIAHDVASGNDTKAAVSGIYVEINGNRDTKRLSKQE